MELSKKDYRLNNLSTSTPVLEGGRGTTRVTGEYDPSLLFLFGERNRSIDAALPATSIQSSNRPSAVCSFLISEDREVAPAQPAQPDQSSITLKPQRAYADATRFDSYAISVLTESYNQCTHLNDETFECIMNKTGLTKKQVCNWFSSKKRNERLKKLKEESIPFKDGGDDIKRRIPFSVGTRNELIGIFKCKPTVTEKEADVLAKKFNVSTSKVVRFFSDERRKEKKCAKLKKAKLTVASSEVGSGGSDVLVTRKKFKEPFSGSQGQSHTPAKSMPPAALGAAPSSSEECSMLADAEIMSSILGSDVDVFCSNLCVDESYQFDTGTTDPKFFGHLSESDEK